MSVESSLLGVISQAVYYRLCASQYSDDTADEHITIVIKVFPTAVVQYEIKKMNNHFKAI